jgi:hypothetical protein
MNKEYSIIGILVVIAIILIYFRSQIFGISPAMTTTSTSRGQMQPPTVVNTGTNIAPTNSNDVTVAGINAVSDLLQQFAPLNTGSDNGTL